MEQLPQTAVVLDCIEYLVPKLVQALKDGVQLQDLAVLMDPVLWNKAQEAAKDLGGMKAELEPMSIEKAEVLVGEGFKLAKAVVAALKA